jgi:hypothetical protein
MGTCQVIIEPLLHSWRGSSRVLRRLEELSRVFLLFCISLETTVPRLQSSFGYRLQSATLSKCRASRKIQSIITVITLLKTSYIIGVRYKYQDSIFY